MPLKLKYSEGEQILCFHGPLLYEAKCLRVEAREKAVKYLVHYSGWSKSWDEWVSESRMIKHNEAGLSKQKELQKSHSVKSRKAAKDVEKASKKGERVNKERVEVSEAKKRPRQETVVSEGPKKKKARAEVVEESSKSEVHVKVPRELKAWLVDDWDLINRQKQLLSLPAKLNVRQILDDYSKEQGEEEVVAGLKEYFDCMLGTQLLYKQERVQYAELLQANPGIAMSNLYGAEHLLRLFVKLGGMLSLACFDAKSLDLLLSHIQHLLQHLCTHAPNLFSTKHYIVAPPDHIRKAL